MSGAEYKCSSVQQICVGQRPPSLWSYGKLAGRRNRDEFKILDKLNYWDFYFIQYQCNVISDSNDGKHMFFTLFRYFLYQQLIPIPLFKLIIF